MRRSKKSGQDNAPLKDNPPAMPVLPVVGTLHAGPVLDRLWGSVATNLTIAVIPAAGHWLAEENPAATADALRRFLAADVPTPS